MVHINNQEFEHVFFNENEVVENKIFTNCKFDNCKLSVPFSASPQYRSIIRNCEFKNSNIYGSCSQSKALIEHTIFQNIKSTELILSGTLFSQVTLKGNFNRLLLSSTFSRAQPVEQNSRYITDQEFLELENYRKHYYEKVAWAIDIRDAEFSTCDLRSCIPGRLVIRNPDTQALVKKEKIKSGGWKAISHLDPILAVSYLGNDDDDAVVIAPTRHKKKFPKYMEFIKILREEGIAEPD